MSEQEPSININLGKTNFEMTRQNSFLYTFIGRAALFNHVWLKRDDLPAMQDESLVQSTYLFENMTFEQEERREHWDNVYSRIIEQMNQLQFPMYLNMPAPSETDVNAYIGATMQNDNLDHIPDEWQ